MSSEEDSDALDNFINDQKSKVKKRYISDEELAHLDDINNFITDDEPESYENSENSSETSSKSMDAIIKRGTTCQRSKLKEHIVSSVLQKTHVSENLESEVKENIINLDSDSNIVQLKIDMVNVIFSTPNRSLKTPEIVSNLSSPLFSDISFSDRSVLSDIGTDLVPFKEHNKNFNYDKPYLKTSIKTSSKLLPLKICAFDTPTCKFPMKKMNTVPTKHGKYSRSISVNDSDEEHDFSFIDEIAKENSHSFSESDDDDIFTESDESPPQFSTRMCTPTLASKKPMYQLSRTVPTKVHIKTLDFISSLLDNVDEKERDSDAVRYRKNFKNLKTALALKIYVIFNEKVFLNKLPHDIDIKWYPRLRKTAGRCRLRSTNTDPIERTISIELATKVLTDAERLLKTLVHEMCHGAVWMINKCSDGHGPTWKSWTYEAQRIFPRLSVSTRCHSYQIQYKYEYWCLPCNKAVKRHSKSLDITRKVCGKCRGKFVLFVNQGDGTKKKVEEDEELNGFPKFVKENYKKYRSTGISHGEVMKILSGKYKEYKEGDDLNNMLTSMNIAQGQHGTL